MPELTCGNNLVGLTEYDGQCEFFSSGAPLSEGIGWGVVLGFGLFFSLLTSLFVFLDYNFGETNFTSEQFNTAGRSVKTGLTASVIVSNGTWAATILQSSNITWKYGVSGPFWYAAGATIQTILFATLAIEVKRKAPNAHTILEIIKYRYGQVAHGVFLIFCFLTNLIVTVMLILGGAAVIEAFTGMNINAAAFLIPVGVIIYTAGGGLKATFIASYIHTAIVYVVLCIFTFQVYAANDTLGSISTVYENLKIVSEFKPVENNKDGSYLTMFSGGGLVFGIISIVTHFATVFADQSYWLSALAAKASATYKGYILGGICWFCIPFSLATTLGLASRALDLPLTYDEASAGLVPSAVALYLMGESGAILLLIMLFMAVATTGSAEQMAVGSLVSYDVYKMYINPKATGQQIINVTRITICVYGIFSGVVAVILLEIGLNLGWVYQTTGIIVGSAVVPISFALTWKNANPIGAIAGATIGMIFAITAWLTYAQIKFGELNIDTIGDNFAMLAGNVTGIFISGVICTVYSLIFPHNFDWNKLKEIPVLEQDGACTDQESAEDLLKAFRFTVVYGTILAGVIIIAWPLLALPAGVFSEAYFSFWVGLAIVWGLLAAFAMIFLPLWESRAGIFVILVNFLSCRRTKTNDRICQKDTEMAVSEDLPNKIVG